MAWASTCYSNTWHLSISFVLRSTAVPPAFALFSRPQHLQRWPHWQRRRGPGNMACQGGISEIRRQCKGLKESCENPWRNMKNLYLAVVCERRSVKENALFNHSFLLQSPQSIWCTGYHFSSFRLRPSRPFRFCRNLAGLRVPKGKPSQSHPAHHLGFCGEGHALHEACVWLGFQHQRDLHRWALGGSREFFEKLGLWRLFLMSLYVHAESEGFPSGWTSNQERWSLSTHTMVQTSLNGIKTSTWRMRWTYKRLRMKPLECQKGHSRRYYTSITGLTAFWRVSKRLKKMTGSPISTCIQHTRTSTCMNWALNIRKSPMCCVASAMDCSACGNSWGRWMLPCWWQQTMDMWLLSRMKWLRCLRDC